MEKLKRRQFTAEFKREAAKLVLEQGYGNAQAAQLEESKHLNAIHQLQSTS